MDAIPSVSGIGPGGIPAVPRRKDVATTTGPIVGRPRPNPRQGIPTREPGSPTIGPRAAMKAVRWALDARPAQGRVGVNSRHLVSPHATHPLLLAEAPLRPGPRGFSIAGLTFVGPDDSDNRRGASPLNSRRPARTRVRRRPSGIVSTTGAAIARPGALASAARGRGSIRGKGVRTG